MVLEELLKRHDILGIPIVLVSFNNSLWHHDVDSGCEHLLKVMGADILINRCQEKTQPTGALSHNLTPPLPQSTLNREDGCIHWIGTEMIDRWQYEIWLSIDDCLGGERVLERNEQAANNQLKCRASTGSSPLCQP